LTKTKEISVDILCDRSVPGSRNSWWDVAFYLKLRPKVENNADFDTFPLVVRQPLVTEKVQQ